MIFPPVFSLPSCSCCLFTLPFPYFLFPVPRVFFFQSLKEPPGDFGYHSISYSLSLSLPARPEDLFQLCNKGVCGGGGVMSERDGKLMNALVSCVTSSLMSLTIKGFILRILLYFQYLGRAYFSLFIFLLTFLFFHVFCNAFFFFFPRSQRSLECDHYRLVCLLRLLIHISLSTSSLFSSLFSIYPCILRRASFP